MMKPSTDDQATGKLPEVKGTVKEAIGKVTDDPELEADGSAEKNASKALNWIGNVEKAVGQ